MNRWALVDANFMIWREFYGAGRREPRLSALGGLANAARLAGELGATRVLWAFDAAPYNRAAFYPGYKASRVDDPADPDTEPKNELRRLVDRMHQTILRPAGVPNVAALRGYEADDHIAAAVAALPAGDSAVIVSGDYDLWQLLSPRVEQYAPSTRKMHTHKTFRDVWDIHPSEWPEAKAIAGCDTDDVPGVPRVAEKTAAKYLAGGMNRMLALYSQIREFVASYDYVRNVLLCRLPFAGCPPADLRNAEPPDLDVWRRVCAELGAPAAVSAFAPPRSGRRVPCG